MIYEFFFEKIFVFLYQPTARNLLHPNRTKSRVDAMM